MGYNVQGGGKLRISADGAADAVNEFHNVMMNPSFIEKNARGGSWSGGKPDKLWYSWCDMDVLTSFKGNGPVDDLIDILDHFGFSVDLTEAADGIFEFEVWYDSKSGQEDLLFKTIGRFFENGSEIDWSGEDGALWKTKVTTGEELQGTVVYG